ncbi:MAG: hypothetical protein V1803_02430 [Candidatus Roizmanbacteria bacterium]
MKKLIIFFLIVFSFLAVRTEVNAWPDFDFDWPDFSFPTSTPTPTPTLAIFKLNPDLFKIVTTSTPTPTNTLTPTLAPPTTTLTVEPTKEENETAEVSPTSTTSAAANVSPTQKPVEKKLSQKDIIYAGVAGLLFLVILIQAWPAVKKFLHDKTA